MAILQSDAIVLRTIDYSETSLIVWLFTRDHGRVHVIAKGARRARSPFEGALEPLVLGQLVFYRKNKREDALEIAKEFDPRRLHLGLRRDLERLYRGLYVGELLTELTSKDEPAPAAFDAASAALEAFCDAPANRLDAALFRCELRLLGAAGFAPALERCAACGRAEVAAFSSPAGGALCDEHARADRAAEPVSSGALKTLAALGAGHELIVGREVAGAARALLDGFVTHHLGKRLRLASYLWRGPRRTPALARSARRA